jgi:iron complex transport system permease protein
VTDTVARSGAAELPVGIVTAAVGAPFFLYLLRTREVHTP